MPIFCKSTCTFRIKLQLSIEGFGQIMKGQKRFFLNFDILWYIPRILSYLQNTWAFKVFNY